MGCIQPQPFSPNDDIIISRERKLELHKFSIPEIKEVDFWIFPKKCYLQKQRNFLTWTPKMKFL